MPRFNRQARAQFQRVSSPQPCKTKVYSQLAATTTSSATPKQARAEAAGGAGQGSRTQDPDYQDGTPTGVNDSLAQNWVQRLQEMLKKLADLSGLQLSSQVFETSARRSSSDAFGFTHTCSRIL